MKNLLITGGSGFIGSHFLRKYVPLMPAYNFINVDKLTYAGKETNVIEIASFPNYRFYKADIAQRDEMTTIFEVEKIDAVINFAAESHVDRSIANSTPFIVTNVLGTQVLLDLALSFNIEKFIQVSTDEVYGSLTDEHLFTEYSPINPSSPYSASKASADLLVHSYCVTHSLNANITRCSNNYGPYQHHEKLIPKMIFSALNNEKLPLYGNGKNIRDWLHVDDHCSAIHNVLFNGEKGAVYNIGGNNEKTNLEIAELILQRLNKPTSLISFVQDRLGHDYRYAIDSTKIQTALGWSPDFSFEQGLNATIDWYINFFRGEL